MSQNDAAHVLMGLGFTGLESEVYAFLVRESPATGYRIAQAIHKPVANTYKAIETLRIKGAIEVEEADTRNCRAIPSDELLDRLAREFEGKRTAAKEAFSRLNQPATDDRVYQINSLTQVLQRGREMLGQASQVALVSAPASLLPELNESLTAAAGREVKVFLKTDSKIELEDVEAQIPTREEDLAAVKGYLRVVVDARSILIARLDDLNEGALYSQNPILASPVHDGMAAEMNLLAVMERAVDGAGVKRLVKASQIVPTSANLKEKPMIAIPADEAVT